MYILTVVGARPQFIKAAVVSRAFAQHGQVKEEIGTEKILTSWAAVKAGSFGFEQNLYGTGRAADTIVSTILGQKLQNWSTETTERSRSRN